MSRADLPPRVTTALLDHFGSPEAVFAASPVEIAAAVTLTPAMLSRLLPERPDGVGLHDLARLHELGAHLITLRDPGYPPLLGQIYDPPAVLYVRGDLTPADQTAVAIVGSRRCSPYGRLVAQTLARDLAARGITVISGLATGIDAAAHLGALEGGGRTIGVLACGLDVPYPREHTELKERIAAQGAVISEVPLGTPPTRGRFPMRNRIISGMSLGVVVVEAPEQSGALITAHQAAEQGREVFAVPGSFNSLHSRGCHQLIREGAKLIDSVEGILEELQVEVAEPRAGERPRLAITADPGACGVGTSFTVSEHEPAPTARSTHRAESASCRAESPDSAAAAGSGDPALHRPPCERVAGESAPALHRLPLAPSLPLTKLTAEEQRLLTSLSLQQKYLDEIIRETSLSSAQASAGLMMLELKGLVSRLPGNVFVRVK